MTDTNTSLLLEGLDGLCGEALEAAETLKQRAIQSVAAFTRGENGRISSALVEENQYATHGLAWLVTYVETLKETLNWSRSLAAENKLGELEELMLQAGFAEYLAQLANGIPMTLGEIIRPSDLGLDDAAIDAFRTRAVLTLTGKGYTPAVRERIATLIAEGLDTGDFGDPCLDETYAMIRDQFRRFADDEVMPFAHEWHLKDELIPMPVVEKMSELGVFGLTIPEEYDGLGLGKMSMCVVSEELSRGYIGVGSLGTRSEIAAELILTGGTDAQKQKWLPQIATGQILPTAVFTEPNTGSDLASLRTRAVRDGDVYKITGNKTWITHAARADVMTLLARSNPNEPGYKGLSMFLAEKQHMTEDEDFPTPGMTGGEIEVLGYRGMKEYELGFDNFEVKAENLLGEEEGNGFKQLMQTFESARIQTAARALGVAQNALELGLRYALDRVQFNRPIIKFPRVAGKLSSMAVEIMMARQLTYASARAKDEGRRCDLEAGMAKLLGARVAWAAADNALQIHGGNGFALEYPISRVLCDARILNIFEGAGEIQAQVIARRLLEGAN
ncbi:acyl-CoA dehydrogenase family protein [Sneathiella chinensis]|uniref:(2S)-methylsuccinyl-CoA dehydrogenase n=1 Tax=Sneathiella chinensis TaxID=349750 RepID=A0ABQ5U235_9PROT|nr:acyl-CoA dehydrogenase family protein [Sneathiella chinensis]GLQ05334.1 (2S)-methylsuccinyl-CoA dehydrogenase [Sneathiella chinensis]